jgi:hypothetical protein
MSPCSRWEKSNETRGRPLLGNRALRENAHSASGCPVLWHPVSTPAAVGRNTRAEAPRCSPVGVIPVDFTRFADAAAGRGVRRGCVA